MIPKSPTRLPSTRSANSAAGVRHAREGYEDHLEHQQSYRGCAYTQHLPHLHLGGSRTPAPQTPFPVICPGGGKGAIIFPAGPPPARTL